MWEIIMPVRRVSNWGGNIIGAFPSLKNGCLVKYESTIERDFLFFLEYEYTVQRYEMQPLVISEIGPDGKSHRYTPDVLVERTSGRTLVECKPAALIDEDRTKRQIALGQMWADSNNCDFVVITDKDLRTGFRLANLKYLWRYARLAVPYAVLERCLNALHRQPEGMTWEVLLTHLDGTAPSLMLPPSLAHLLFRHVLTTDLDRPLSPASVIILAKHKGRI
jgi:TnsA endonuclease N terminal